MLIEGRTTINSTDEGSPYGWLIYESYIEDNSFGRATPVEVFGPSGISDENNESLEAGKGQGFELYDDDGNLYYKGRLIGEFEGLEPLDDYGMPNAGCTAIKVNGEWV